MNDRFVAGGAAGIIGALIMVTFNLALNLIPGVSIKLLSTASQMFIPTIFVGTLQGNLMGFIVHLVCGGLLGVAFVFLLDLTSFRHILLKGVAFGIGTWFILCGMVSRLLRLGVQDKFLDSLLLMLIHIPFGLALALFIKHFYKLNQTFQKN